MKAFISEDDIEQSLVYICHVNLWEGWRCRNSSMARLGTCLMSCDEG